MSPSAGGSGSGSGRPRRGRPSGGSKGSAQGGSRSGSGRGGAKRDGGPRRSGPAGGSKQRRGEGAGPTGGRSARSTGGGSGKKRIPPPPPRDQRSRDQGPEAEREARGDYVVERADDGSSRSGTGGSKGGRNRRRTGRSRVEVGGIEFPGVAPSTAAKLRNRLAEAAGAFEAERFTESAQLLSSIERLAPGVPEVAELGGLTQYRLGHWIRALNQLERFAEITGSVEQHPVMADCCRALRRWSRAEELWHELGEASPGPELIEEGRIVQAGALADRGRLDDAIRFMERAPDVKGRPGVHHLRRWYMLGDLYERAGDTARARRLFSDIVRVDGGFGDAAERAASL